MPNVARRIQDFLNHSGSNPPGCEELSIDREGILWLGGVWEKYYLLPDDLCPYMYMTIPYATTIGVGCEWNSFSEERLISLELSIDVTQRIGELMWFARSTLLYEDPLVEKAMPKELEFLKNHDLLYDGYYLFDLTLEKSWSEIMQAVIFFSKLKKEDL